jgi:spore maturation protein CgeB
MVAAGWSPSVRLFEAAACGTPIISDRWPGLTDLLPDRDAILIADDTEAVVAALTALDLQSCRAMAENARRIILRDHTGTARARELLRYLAETREPARRFSSTGDAAQPAGAR